MKQFARLFVEIDQTNRTNEKVAALKRYFDEAPAEDASWAIYFLMGQRPRRSVNTRLMREWIAELSGHPAWMIDECYDRVGDLAETLALLAPEPDAVETPPLHRLIEERLLPLGAMSDDEKKALLIRTWRELPRDERFVWNKLITGGFRVGVSRALLTRALSQSAGVDQAVMAHRLMGAWEPGPEAYRRLFADDSGSELDSRPYPFFLASPLESSPEELGDRDDWQAEWKWDGIRAQAIKRKGSFWLWTRGEELVTDRYPEIEAAAESLPDGCVIDGELMGWRDGPLPFHLLQKRIGRKTLGKSILSDVPVALIAYDLLEWQGEDIRPQPLSRRRKQLDELIERAKHPSLHASPIVKEPDWNSLTALRLESRRRRVEGLMLKRRDSAYGTGRTRDVWFKWKIDPFSIDAVLINAQRGHGRRAGLYTDYTFGVWNEHGELVPIAKAYSGLSDKEIRRVDRFVRDHTTESFGPVRAVKPELVFELHFEGIQPSSRHKAGVAVRFPRMARWREDKSPADADTLESVKRLLDADAKV